MNICQKCPCAIIQLDSRIADLSHDRHSKPLRVDELKA